MPGPEPYVKTWYRLDFDVPAATAARSACTTAIQGVEANSSDHRTAKPTSSDWGGRHYDEFLVEFTNLLGQADDVVEALVDQRNRIDVAIDEADAEIRLRQGQWTAWQNWWRAQPPDERPPYREPMTYVPTYSGPH